MVPKWLCGTADQTQESANEHEKRHIHHDKLEKSHHHEPQGIHIYTIRKTLRDRQSQTNKGIQKFPLSLSAREKKKTKRKKSFKSSTKETADSYFLSPSLSAGSLTSLASPLITLTGLSDRSLSLRLSTSSDALGSHVEIWTLCNGFLGSRPWTSMM